MEAVEGATRSRQAVLLARGAVEWLLRGQAAAFADASLYHGQAGVLLALKEASEQVGDERCGFAVADGVEALAARVDSLEDCSLYFGLAGIAGTLRSLGQDEAADRALRHIRDRFNGERWSEMFELLAGNAGIALGALWAGDVDLAVLAVTPYLTTADRTEHGMNWAVRPSPARSHHIAHGTLGIVYALAAVGHSAGRADMIDMALAGAADVAGRNEADLDGFLVPHSDPPHRPGVIERYSFGWCNGPAGDAQVFRLLARVTEDSTWTDLVDRCWRTVIQSGVPNRIRPGFWDNNGRCCGTAGVLALACDRIVERGDDFEFSDILVGDLAARAIIDDSGVRWSNHEYRLAPPVLAPLPGWAMGNAGILRELLRYARLRETGVDGYAVHWPDHPATAPNRAAEHPGSPSGSHRPRPTQPD